MQPAVSTFDILEQCLTISTLFVLKRSPENRFQTTFRLFQHLFGNFADGNRIDFVLHGFVQEGVNFQDFALPAFKFFGAVRTVNAHRPFEFGIACAHLFFVRALGIPKSVGRHGFLDGLSDVQFGGNLINLRFGQVGNRADVHTAVAVFGEKAHAEIFDY